MDYIKQFINYLAKEKRYSVHTVTAYQKDLLQFVDFYIKNFGEENILKANNSIIRSWIVELIENKISTRSVNRKVSSLKSFFNYCLKNDYIKENPTSKLVLPKVKKRLPEFLQESETDKLFEKIEFPNTFEGVRDRLILELFYATGMRLSELTNLKIQAVNLSQHTVKVLGKRNKERILPLNNKCIELYDRYLSYRSKLKTDSNYLFLTLKGEKIYNKLVYSIVNKYLSSVSSLNKKSPHILRHTFATHMLNNGADLNAIKELLGHSSLAATEVYTHNSIEKLKNIYKQAHPKA